MENNQQEQKEKSEMKLSPLTANIIAILSLIFTYFVIAMVLGSSLGIRLPDPFYNDQPFPTILTNPSYSIEKYNYDVNPKELQKILESRSYSQKYQANVFDCSDMAIELSKYLQEDLGYDTSVIGDDLNVHAWVYVWTEKNEAWAIEVTMQSVLMRGSSGEVVGDNWWDYLFTLRNFFDFFSDESPKEFYYPSEQRKGLHIREWNEVEEGR